MQDNSWRWAPSRLRGQDTRARSMTVTDVTNGGRFIVSTLGKVACIDPADYSSTGWVEFSVHTVTPKAS